MFTFIESAGFARWLPEYLSDGEYARLQNFLLIHPLAGALVSGSGGVRKLSWKRSGQGKRGGVRVIYYVRYAPLVVDNLRQGAPRGCACPYFETIEGGLCK